MDKIFEALKSILPEEHVKDVSSAVSEMLDDAKSDLEREFSVKLEEAYQNLSDEKTKDERIAEEGYQEAFGIIQELRNRLESQKEEYDAALKEGYQTAWEKIQEVKKQKDNFEGELYEKYDSRLDEMKLYIVEKVDEFLAYKGAEIYEQARRDVLNDPRMAEHRVALEKIVDITSGYLSDEDFAFATSSKLEEAQKQLDAKNAQIRIQEGKIFRLATENKTLNEEVGKARDVLNESRKVTTKNEQKERQEKAKNASGRGRIVADDKLIAEYHNEKSDNDDDDDDDDDENLTESQKTMRDMRTLAGLDRVK